MIDRILSAQLAAGDRVGHNKQQRNGRCERRTPSPFRWAPFGTGRKCGLNVGRVWPSLATTISGRGGQERGQNVGRLFELVRASFRAARPNWPSGSDRLLFGQRESSSANWPTGQRAQWASCARPSVNWLAQWSVSCTPQTVRRAPQS